MSISVAVLLCLCFSVCLAADKCRKPVNLQPQSTCGAEQTMFNEGECLCCYYDTKNIPTIGIGFNLQRSDAAQVMAKYQLELTDVLQDCQKKTTDHCLTDQQAQEIFVTMEYPEFEQCAEEFVPGLPEEKKAAITDMAFMGCEKLNQFAKMKAALQKQDWETAANEAKNSKWCKDVKSNRCNSDYNCIAG